MFFTVPCTTMSTKTPGVADGRSGTKVYPVIFTTGSAWTGNVVDVVVVDDVVDVLVVEVVVDVVDEEDVTRGSVVVDVESESEGSLGGGTHALIAATAATASMVVMFVERVGCI